MALHMSSVADSTDATFGSIGTDRIGATKAPVYGVYLILPIPPRPGASSRTTEPGGQLATQAAAHVESATVRAHLAKRIAVEAVGAERERQARLRFGLRVLAAGPVVAEHAAESVAQLPRETLAYPGGSGVTSRALGSVSDTLGSRWDIRLEIGTLIRHSTCSSLVEWSAVH